MRRYLIPALLAIAVTAGCSSGVVPGHASSSNAPATPSSAALTAAHWSGAQLAYGGDITRVAGLTYQPGVVLVGGGAGAIRGASADGLAWTLAGNAPGVAQLHVGSIMLATVFAAGRVIGLKHVGPDVQVLLAPVALTDVIRDGTFSSARPIPLSDGLYYSQDFASAAPTSTPSGSAHSFLGRLAPGTPVAASLPAPSASPPQSRAGNFTMRPFCCSDGLGVHVGYRSDAGVLSADLSLAVSAPTATFHIGVGGGHLVDASITIHGAGALRFSLHGDVVHASGNVTSGPIWVPGSLTIPLTGPFTLNFAQAFTVTMQIGGAGAINAGATYPISGELGFGFGGRSGTPNGLSFSDPNPIAKTVAAPAIGIVAVSLGWSLRASVSIGLPALSFGIWYEIEPGLALAVDDSPMSLSFGCATAAISVRGRYGVGYRIPSFIASALSAVLSIFGAKPIPATGGLAWGPYPIWNPASEKYCAGH